MGEKKISDKGIEMNLANVKATLAMEDMYLTDDEVEVLRKYAKGIYGIEDVKRIFDI